MKLTVLTLYHEFPLIFIVRFILTLVAFVAGVIFAVHLFKTDRISRAQRNIMIILLLYMLVVLYLTVIGRYSHEEPNVRLELFYSYKNYFSTGDKYELCGIIINILMFIPFGFLVAELFRNKKPLLIGLFAGIVLTLTIEILQYLTHTGTFEIDDILHNTVGSLFGVVIWTMYNRIRKQTKPRRTI